MRAFGETAADMRRCAFCGNHMAANLTQCPFCREAVPHVNLSRRTRSNGRREIRTGLLYILLGAVIDYFAGGYGSAFQIPLPANVLKLVMEYLSPLLFLGGLGLTVYGIFLRIRS